MAVHWDKIHSRSGEHLLFKDALLVKELLVIILCKQGKAIVDKTCLKTFMPTFAVFGEKGRYPTVGTLRESYNKIDSA